MSLRVKSSPQRRNMLHAGYADRARYLLPISMVLLSLCGPALAPRLTAQAGRASAESVAPVRSQPVGAASSGILPAGAPVGTGGEPPGVTIDAATADVLRGLGARASVIFAGRVLEISRNDAAGYVDIVFYVEKAIRGCGRTANYVLREWAGLWSESEARYVPGQRLLMLLAARGPSGMSAPVGGAAGAIPLLATRQPPLLHGGARPTAFSTAEAVDAAVDLRWVETLASRRVSPTDKAETGDEGAVDQAASGWSGPVRPLPGASALRVAAPFSKLKLRTADAPIGPDLQTVLSLLQEEALLVQPTPGVSLAP